MPLYLHLLFIMQFFIFFTIHYLYRIKPFILKNNSTILNFIGLAYSRPNVFAASSVAEEIISN